MGSMERRLAAVLIGDVVGYGRLSQIDEEGTRARFDADLHELFEPKIAAHHGRLIKTMGDGLLVEFHSVVDAVRCAIDIQRDKAERNASEAKETCLVYRMGINLGDVIVEGGDIHGDGVNMAHRLQELADQGGIAISGAVYDQVKTKIGIGYAFLGERSLKNITDPVRLYRVLMDPGAASDKSISVAPNIHDSRPDKPAIAVLPFTNLGGDQDQEYFSEGITDDIITELSRFRNLVVIARNSSFAYKGRSVDIGTIARELGVEYVLEGSIRRAGQRVRISAQLINAASGNHVWAERYERELIDIFSVQDDVSLSIVAALAVELEDEALERARRKPLENLQAYEYWLRGKRLVFLMGKNILEARSHFERAAALDPNFSSAHSGLALTYQMEALDFPRPADFHAAYEKSFQLARRALLLDETNHQAHLALAYGYLYRRDCGQAKKHIERAIKLNPSDGDTLSHAAWLLAMIGEPEAAIRFGEMALKLNPHHPDWYLAFLSTALFAAHRYSEAHVLKSGVPEAFIDSPFFGAATLAHMGRLDEARQWAARAITKLAATPGGELAVAEGRVVGILLDNNPFCRQEDRDHFANGMRKAGVPG
ncbi:MAG TPA: adenylate/guanylate cyclase domain-containing protein [Pseudolabrys sp.]|nr:adenylate/guanylate cyclase domain-containing protein [Pseudolabrys sp.]